MKQVLVISGPSGCGKSSVLEALRQCGSQIHIAKSVTTRPPRSPNEDGYFFISAEQFYALQEQDQLLESNRYTGSKHLYATLRSELEIPGVLCTILEIDVNGLLQLQSNQDFLQETALTTIFLVSPSGQELFVRLKNRGSENKNTLIRRLETAIGEVSQISLYDYVMVTDIPPHENAAKLMRLITEGVAPSSSPFCAERFIRDMEEIIHQLTSK